LHALCLRPTRDGRCCSMDIATIIRSGQAISAPRQPLRPFRSPLLHTIWVLTLRATWFAGNMADTAATCRCCTPYAITALCTLLCGTFIPTHRASFTSAFFSYCLLLRFALPFPLHACLPVSAAMPHAPAPAPRHTHYAPSTPAFYTGQAPGRHSLPATHYLPPPPMLGLDKLVGHPDLGLADKHERQPWFAYTVVPCCRSVRRNTAAFITPRVWHLPGLLLLPHGLRYNLLPHTT